MVEFELHRDLTGQFRWRLYSGDDVVACSGRGFANRIECELAIEKLRQIVVEAPVAKAPQQAGGRRGQAGQNWPQV